MQERYHCLCKSLQAGPVKFLHNVETTLNKRRQNDVENRLIYRRFNDLTKTHITKLHLLYKVECFIEVSATDKNGNLTCEIIAQFFLIVVKLVNKYSIV